MPYERFYSSIAMQYRLELESDNVMGMLIVSDISFLYPIAVIRSCIIRKSDIQLVYAK